MRQVIDPINQFKDGFSNSQNSLKWKYRAISFDQTSQTFEVNGLKGEQRRAKPVELAASGGMMFAPVTGGR